MAREISERETKDTSNKQQLYKDKSNMIQIPMTKSTQNNPIEQFEELKKQFQQLEQEQNDYLEEQAQKIIQGLQIEDIAKQSLGNDSEHYHRFIRELKDRELDPISETKLTGWKLGDNGINKLEQAIQKREDIKQATIESKTRQVYNTTETTVKIKIKTQDGRKLAIKR